MPTWTLLLVLWTGLQDTVLINLALRIVRKYREQYE
jgi:hypothetical protein